MPQPHTLNWATPTDYDALADIVFDAVRNGPSKYTQSQRAAWVPVRPSTGSGVGAGWAARLQGQVIAIARNETRAIGFMTLAPEGYIDFAYIRPDASFVLRQAQESQDHRPVPAAVRHDQKQSP